MYMKFQNFRILELGKSCYLKSQIQGRTGKKLLHQISNSCKAACLFLTLPKKPHFLMWQFIRFVYLQNKNLKVLTFLSLKQQHLFYLWVLILPSGTAQNGCVLSFHMAALQIFEDDDCGQVTFTRCFN